jgi:hypothetical protein
MIKKPIGTTYYYEDFINDSEKDELLKWSLDSIEYMDFAKPVNGEKDQNESVVRHFIKLSQLKFVPDLVYKLKETIIKLEQISPAITDPANEDLISAVGDGGYIEPHIDYNGMDETYYTRRYNLLISLPTDGGQPIYNGRVLNLNVKSIWRCDAGLYTHSSVINSGGGIRINLSFGFMIPKIIKSKTLNTLI